LGKVDRVDTASAFPNSLFRPFLGRIPGFSTDDQRNRVAEEKIFFRPGQAISEAHNFKEPRLIGKIFAVGKWFQTTTVAATSNR
jgi:hypothetical protein